MYKIEDAQLHQPKTHEIFALIATDQAWPRWLCEGTGL
jgi:hypothetical protein